MFKLNQRVIVNENQSHGSIVGTGSLVSPHGDLVSGFLVLLDPKYEGYVVSDEGHRTCYVSTVFCAADRLSAE